MISPAAEEGRFQARGWLLRSCSWFGACRPRLVAQRSWQAKQAELDDSADVERQHHLKDGPSLEAKEGEVGGGGEQRYRSRLGIPMLSPGMYCLRQLRRAQLPANQPMFR
jgi:hypothetical protein